MVDDNDEVIGQKLKSICIRDKILKRGACILVFNDPSFQSILLQERGPGVRYPGLLCFPGGGLLSGDSYRDGAWRELREELFHGSVLDESISFEELFKIRKTWDQEPEFVTVFRTVHPGPFYPNPREVRSCRFEFVHSVGYVMRYEAGQFTESARGVFFEYARRYPIKTV